ncbi:hypothetical protein [Nonomuraea typhae]|uniref:hypothetical protein n=1 Tax=Nonomuraea typhae TaxID=2603600 RepID=UPI0012F9916F|nr:hypothetical protein [Nonomuraea typhae]
MDDRELFARLGRLSEVYGEPSPSLAHRVHREVAARRRRRRMLVAAAAAGTAVLVAAIPVTLNQLAADRTSSAAITSATPPSSPASPPPCITLPTITATEPPPNTFSPDPTPPPNPTPPTTPADTTPPPPPTTTPADITPPIPPSKKPTSTTDRFLPPAAEATFTMLPDVVESTIDPADLPTITLNATRQPPDDCPPLQTTPPAGTPSPGPTTTIQATTPTGKPFVPDFLGEDGTVVGRTPDGELWEAAPGDGRLTRISAGKSETGTGVAAGPGGVRTWARDFDLLCRDAQGQMLTISPQGVAKDSGVWVSKGVIVAHDPMLQPWAAKGCARGALLPDHGKTVLGEVVAVDHPEAFVVEPSNDKVVRVLNLETGQIITERPIQEDMSGRDWRAAVNRHIFAWAKNDMLHRLDRTTWKPRPSLGVPDGPARLTAGANLVVYSTDRAAVVLDPRIDTVRELDGPAWAAGDWFLYGGAGAYHLGKAD